MLQNKWGKFYKKRVIPDLSDINKDKIKKTSGTYCE